MICKNCGREIGTANFCPYCGIKSHQELQPSGAANNAPAPMNTAPAPNNNTSASDKKGKKGKKGILIGIIAAVLVIAIAAGVVLIRPWENARSDTVRETVYEQSDETVAGTAAQTSEATETQMGYVQVTTPTESTAIGSSVFNRVFSAGAHHTVGLKVAEGTVVAVGNNDDGKCSVEGWTKIISVSAGSWHTVGLRADGTVVATGDNSDGQCNVSGWKLF